MARKPISKKLRFEVFKRDLFTCQYCGRMAPDVVLEVDHLKPCSKGGDNDIFNLLTSCKDCNRGKSDRALSDNVVLKKQQAVLKELAEKQEQLKLLIEWKNGLKDINSNVADELVENVFFDSENDRINQSIKKQLLVLLKKYPARIVIDVCYSLNEHYFDLVEIEKQCRFTQQNEKHPYRKDVNYIVAILCNRNMVWARDKRKIAGHVEAILRPLYNTEQYAIEKNRLELCAKVCDDLGDFLERADIERW